MDVFEKSLSLQRISTRTLKATKVQVVCLLLLSLCACSSSPHLLGISTEENPAEEPVSTPPLPTTPPRETDDPKAATLYWTDATGLWSKTGEGAAQRVRTVKTRWQSSLSGDPVNKKLYWYDDVFKSIQRSNYDGSELEDVLSVDAVKYLNIDPIKQHLYWAGVYENVVYRWKGEAEEIETLFTTSSRIESFIVDPYSQRLFWIEASESSVPAARDVKMASLDGVDPRIVATRENEANHLSLSHDGDGVFWAEEPGTLLGMQDFSEGAEVEQLFTFEEPIEDLVFFETRNAGKDVFWASSKERGVLQLSEDAAGGFSLLELNRVSFSDDVYYDPQSNLLAWSERAKSQLGIVTMHPGEDDVQRVVSPPSIDYAYLAWNDDQLLVADERNSQILTLGDQPITDKALLRQRVLDPEYIALDSQAGRIYWSGDRAFQSASLDGRDLRDLSVRSESPQFFTPLNVSTLTKVSEISSSGAMFRLDQTEHALYWKPRGIPYWKPHINFFRASASGEGVLGEDIQGHSPLDGNRVLDHFDADFEARIVYEVIKSSVTNLYALAAFNLETGLRQMMIENSENDFHRFHIDTQSKKIYWGHEDITYPGEDASYYRLMRSDLDGENIETLLERESTSNPAHGAVESIVSIVTHHASQKMYWCTTDRNGIMRANMDGSEVEVFIAGEACRYNLEIDPLQDILYWTRDRTMGLETYNELEVFKWHSRVVMHAKLDGSETKELIVPNIESPRYTAFDSASKTLIFIDVGTQALWQAEQNQPPKRIAGLILPSLSRVALDSLRHKVYWADGPWKGGNATQLRRANFDGSEPEILFDVGSNRYIDSLAIDTEAGEIYTLEKPSPSGPGRYKNIVRHPVGDPTQGTEVLRFSDEQSISRIALDQGRGKIYWSGWDSDQTAYIARANLDGSDTEDWLTGLKRYPRSLTVRPLAP